MVLNKKACDLEKFTRNTMLFIVVLSTSNGYCQDDLTQVAIESITGIQRSGREYSPATTTQNYIVLPNKKTLLSAWTEYNPTLCITIDPGKWTYSNPIYGEASQSPITATLGSGACPGKNFTFQGIYYKWTSTDPKAKQDSFNATWATADGKFSNSYTFNITPTNINILGVDLEKNVITIQLSEIPGQSKTSGTIELDFKGEQNYTYTTPDLYTSGIQKITSIDRTAIPKGTYSSVTAKWNVSDTPLSDTYTLPSPLEVLGIIRYSQYNVPSESMCSGINESVWIVNSLTKCKFTKSTLVKQFANKTRLNGTGTSISYGFIKTGKATTIATSCKGKFPKGATLGNSFLKVPSVIGSCNKKLVAGTSVAISEDSPLSCGDSIQLVNEDNSNFSKKKADDLCPGCIKDFRGTDGHIDNFISDQACDAHSAIDLGNFWTIQTQ